MAIKVQDWKTEADELEFTDLQERQSYYAQLIQTRAAEHRTRAIAELKELMAKHSLSADDLAEPKVSAKKTISNGKKMTPKYRDPANPENVWTGQGRTPRWMPENKDQWVDFLIDKPTEAEPVGTMQGAEPEQAEEELQLTLAEPDEQKEETAESPEKPRRKSSGKRNPET